MQSQLSASSWRRRNPRVLIGFLAAALLLSGLTAAHLHVSAQGPGYTGPLLLFAHLFELGAALALLTLCTGVGRFALTRWGVDLEQPLETLIFAAAAGAGITAVSILVLGLLGGLQTVTLGLLLLLLATFTRKELSELPALATRGLSHLIQNSGGRLLSVFGTLVLAAVAFFLVVLALAPPVDWDALMYHLHVPAEFLENERIYLPEDNLHTALVGLVHMLYLPLLAIGSSSGPAILSGLMAVLLGLAVFSFCNRFLSSRTGGLSLALLWGTTTLLLVAITPRLDVTLGLYLFLAQYALLVALSAPSSRAHFYLAAVLLGFAIGLKYNAGLYVLALAPLILWVAVSSTRSFKASLGSLALFGLLVSVGALPWLVKNWILLGAPLYPMFAAPALEGWLVPFFGSLVAPTSVDPEIFRMLSQVRVPFNLPDAFFAPHRLTVEPEGVFYRANPALFLLPLWVLFVRNRTLNWLVVPAVAYLLVLLVPLPATNLRYLIPAIAPLTIVVAHVMVTASERLLSRSTAHLMLVLLGALALMLSASPGMMYAWMTGTKAMAHLVGATSAEEYLADHFAFRLFAPVIRYANTRLPEDSRILMLFESRAYYFKPSVVQDIRLTNWPLLSQTLAPGDCLEASGITHVLLGNGALGYYVERGLNEEIIQWEAFREFEQRCLEPVYVGRAFVLYQLM